MKDSDFILVMRFLIKHELENSVFFGEKENGELWIAENCNDLFWWGTADLEIITIDNLKEYELAIQDCKKVWKTGESYAGVLFACRIRKMRPQNSCYVSYPKQIWALLDDVGPEREVNFCNPYTRLKAEQRWEEKAPPYFKEIK